MRNLLVVLVAVVMVSTGFAQHSDIFVYQRDGQLVTTDGVAERRVFSNLFDFFGHPFGNTSLPRAFVGDDPGFQTNSSPIAGTSVLPAGEILSGDFLPFGFPDGATGNVLHWDLSGDVDFGAIPTGHFFGVTDVSDDDSFVLDGGGQPEEGVLLGLVNSANVIHEHAAWRLDDGDGDPETDPAGGVYLMVMQLHVNGVESSDPFAVLLNSTDISVAQQNLATAWVEDNFDTFIFPGDSILGDFDDNGLLQLADIDQLVAAVAGSVGDLRFDLDGDGTLSLADVDAWRAVAGAANLPSAAAYLPGDGNLDGVVDASDFNLWNGSKFTSVAAWSAGDFNADGVVDASDFNLWNGNKFQSADAVFSVPEPDGLGCLLVLSFLVFRSGKSRVGKNQ